MKFSIIITTFNRPDILARAINSVAKQTYKNYELIIVDDASTDHNKNEEIIAGFTSIEINYILHKTNKGISASRNTGIAATSDSNIVFLDDDDWLHPEYLESLRDHLKKYPQIDFCWCGKKNIFYQQGKLIKEQDFIYHASSVNKKDTCPMLSYWSNNLGFMVKKHVFDQVGLYDTRMAMAEDVDLLLRMLNAKMKFEAIPKVLVNIEVNRTTQHLSHGKEHENLPILFANNAEFLKKEKVIWAYYMRSYIFALYRAGQKPEARKQLLKLIMRSPRKLPIIFRAIKYEFRH